MPAPRTSMSVPRVVIVGAGFAGYHAARVCRKGSVGVCPDQLVGALSLPTDRGRVEVHETLVVPGRTHVFACGECAAVPDLTRPGSITAMTAQHAQRQGKLVARNVAASLTGQDLEPYRHHDLGFLVDLGGLEAAANPLHVPLSGVAAKTVTRGYHLLSLPGNQTRSGLDHQRDGASASRTARSGQRRSRAAGVHEPAVIQRPVRVRIRRRQPTRGPVVIGRHWTCG